MFEGFEPMCHKARSTNLRERANWQNFPFSFYSTFARNTLSDNRYRSRQIESELIDIKACTERLQESARPFMKMATKACLVPAFVTPPSLLGLRRMELISIPEV